jgi:hypothetical protein
MNDTTLSPTELHRTWAAIRDNGGGFCAHLARAWFHADGLNKCRLDAAFKHLLTEYGPGSRHYIDRAL